MARRAHTISHKVSKWVIPTGQGVLATTGAAQAADGCTKLLTSIGMCPEPASATVVFGSMALLSVGCSLYKRFVSDQREEDRQQETHETVEQLQQQLVAAMDRDMERAEQRDRLAEVLNEHAESIGHKLEQLDQDHPLRAMQDVLLAADDPERLEEVLCVHTPYEAALARFINQHFELLEGMSELTLTELREMRTIVETNDRELARGIDLLVEQASLHHDLQLMVETYDPDSTFKNPFIYSRQRVPIFGRWQESRRLADFLFEPHPTKAGPTWWLWHGPAGQGKTRLAHQLCLDARAMGWHAGFLDRETEIKEWKRLALTGNTLVVIDYVGERAAEISKAIQELTVQHKTSDSRLRFLLLERSDEGPWRDAFDRAGHSGSEDRLAECIYAAPVALPAPPVDALHRIMGYVLEERGQTGIDLGQSYAVLESIDPQRRPLYAAMVAEQIAEHGLEQVGMWDTKQLHDVILDDELARWARHGIGRAHVNALALATILGSLHPNGSTGDADPSEAIRACQTDGVIPDITCRSEHQWESLAAFAGCERRANALPGVQPDVLGEAFVVGRLLGELRLPPHEDHPGIEENAESVRADSAALLDAAWRTNPFRTVSWINLALRDMPGAAIRAGLLDRKPTTHLQQIAFGILILNATYRVGPNGIHAAEDRAAVESSLHHLDRLASAEHAPMDLKVLLARSLFNAHADTDRIGTAAQGWLARLERLAQASNNAPEVRLELAKALTNAVFSLAEAARHGPYDHERASEYIQHLKRLVRASNYAPKITLELAKALTNAVLGLARAAEHGPYDDKLAQTSLDQLETLRQQSNNAPEITLELAEALTNAVLGLARAAQHGPYDHERASEYIQHLKRLAQASNNAPEVRLALAKVLTNAVSGLARAAQHGPYDDKLAQTSLDQLETLRQQSNNAPEITLRLAEALTNAVLGLANAAQRGAFDHERSKSHVDRLGELTDESGGDQAVRMHLAMTIGHCTRGIANAAEVDSVAWDAPLIQDGCKLLIWAQPLIRGIPAMGEYIRELLSRIHAAALARQQHADAELIEQTRRTLFETPDPPGPTT